MHTVQSFSSIAAVAVTLMLFLATPSLSTADEKEYKDYADTNDIRPLFDANKASTRTLGLFRDNFEPMDPAGDMLDKASDSADTGKIIEDAFGGKGATVNDISEAANAGTIIKKAFAGATGKAGPAMKAANAQKLSDEALDQVNLSSAGDGNILSSARRIVEETNEDLEDEVSGPGNPVVRPGGMILHPKEVADANELSNSMINGGGIMRSSLNAVGFTPQAGLNAASGTGTTGGLPSSLNPSSVVNVGNLVPGK